MTAYLPGRQPLGAALLLLLQACILDGSAMSNPAIAARFPRRQRRGSAPATHGHSQQHSDTSPSSGSCRSECSAATGAHQERGGAHAGGRNGGRHHAAGGGSGHSTSAKNPFAATPKNIRQQQLLCNLMAAADSFTEGSGPSAPAAGAGSSRPSLDCSAMPPPCPPGRPSVDRASFDITMSRATSRTSLESWGYMQRGRNSCDLNGAAANRASMDSYSASMRSSMDRASCWSGRPSVDSTFSAYAPVTPSPSSLAQQQQQQQMAATAAAAAAAAAVAARASFEAALPPNPTSNSISRMGVWQAGRASCDLAALSPAAMPASAFSRYSLESGADGQAAAAAVAAAASAAAASAMQMEQQQRSLSGLLRFDSSAMSNVSSASMDSASTPCPPSPATPAELAAAAAAMAARRNQMAQLQNIIDSMSAATSGISAETAAALATLTAHGVSPDTAALLLFQAQQNAAAASNGVAPEALLFQQQLQQIMQANQVAAANSAAAQAAAASQLYAATVARSHASQQRQQSRQCWQSLGFNAADAELLQEQEAQLPATYDANALQQQLEALQCMQL